MSLYGNLFRYRERIDRKPLENFLSEGIRDLLDRLSRQQATELIFGLFLNERRRTTDIAASRSLGSLRNRLASSASIHWETQCAIGFDGRTRMPDLSAFGSAGRILAIEVKVDQPLADQQLEHYGGGLVEENRFDPDLGCALIFLTHTTTIPNDFLRPSGTSKYHAPLRGACSWTDVYEWFRNQADSNPSTFAGGLIREFTEFLKENHMDSMNKTDLDALTNFLSCGTQSKIAPLLRRTRDVIAPTVSQRYYYGRNDIDPFAYTSGDKVWDWCYRNEKREKWYIAWGLRLGGQDTRLAISFPGGDKALFGFVLVTSEKRNDALPILSLPEAVKKELREKGWILEESQMACLKMKEAAAFAGSAGGVIEGFALWVQESFPEADRIMSECIALLKAQ